MAYRYWCGECGFKTDWTSESQIEHQQMKHYASRHPRIPPGGLVETNRKNPNGISCARVAALLVLLLIVAVSCRH